MRIALFFLPIFERGKSNRDRKPYLPWRQLSFFSASSHPRLALARPFKYVPLLRPRPLFLRGSGRNRRSLPKPGILAPPPVPPPPWRFHRNLSFSIILRKTRAAISSPRSCFDPSVGKIETWKPLGLIGEFV